MIQRLSVSAVGIALVLASAGCRTCHGTDDKWTIDTAIQEIGTRSIVAECSAEQFTVLEYTFIRGQGLTTNPKVIRFRDIQLVRLKPEPVWFVLSPFVAGLIGPLVYDLVLEMHDGTEYRLIRECYPGFSIFPLWLYPYVPIHGYPLGEAIDYMRQHTVNSDPGSSPGGMAPGGR